MRTLRALAVVLAIVAAYHAGRASHQNVNDLISVGFTVYDPDGWECAHFDYGLGTLAPSYYTTPKPH